jgi:hypothetical protein
MLLSPVVDVTELFKSVVINDLVILGVQPTPQAVNVIFYDYDLSHFA